MKVIETAESMELCTEAGWEAVDITVDAPIDREVILRLGTLGSLSYLRALKQPFYRIQAAHYMIKGLEGKCQLRAAMLMGEEAILDRIRELLESDEDLSI